MLRRVQTDTGFIYDGYDPEKDPLVEHLHDWCCKHSVPAGAKILEPGCGGGRITMVWRALSKRYRWNFQHTAFDHAENAVRLAQERNTDAECVVWKLENLPLDSRRFDVIFTHTVLQHNSGWKQDKVLPAIHRTLAPNGLLLLLNEKTFSSLEDGALSDPFFCDGRQSAGTAAWWINRVASVGFEFLEYHKSQYTFRRI